MHSDIMSNFAWESCKACLQQWQVPIRAQAGDNGMPLPACCKAGFCSTALRGLVHMVQPAVTHSTHERCLHGEDTMAHTSVGTDARRLHDRDVR